MFSPVHQMASLGGPLQPISVHAIVALYLRCVRTHMTRSQLQLKRARCKISNKGYLSLNIFVILCHNMVIRSWDITTIPKGLSETLFGRF